MDEKKLSDGKNSGHVKIFVGLLYSIGVVIVALLIFQGGVFVGYHKAAFSYQQGENYYQIIGGPRNGMMGPVPSDDFSNAHGVIGRIIKINLPVIVIEDRDNIEKTVLVGDDTDIRLFRNAATAADLTLDQVIVVIGEPESNGQIDAKFIRLMPPGPAQMMNPATSSPQN